MKTAVLASFWGNGQRISAGFHRSAGLSLQNQMEYIFCQVEQRFSDYQLLKNDIDEPVDQVLHLVN